MRSLGVNFLLFRRRLGVNLNEKFLSFNFCGVNFLGFFGFLSEKLREFFGADFGKFCEFFSFFSLKFRAEKLKLEFSPNFKQNSFCFKSNPQKNSKYLNFLEFFEIFVAKNLQNFYNFYQKRLGYA